MKFIKSVTCIIYNRNMNKYRREITTNKYERMNECMYVCGSELMSELMAMNE